MSSTEMCMERLLGSYLEVKKKKQKQKTVQRESPLNEGLKDK